MALFSSATNGLDLFLNPGLWEFQLLYTFKLMKCQTLNLAEEKYSLHLSIAMNG
jgi:hypothetical protein